MSDLLEVKRLFCELAESLAAMRDFHWHDQHAVERIKAAEGRARYGAELAARAADGTPQDLLGLCFRPKADPRAERALRRPRRISSAEGSRSAPFVQRSCGLKNDL